jgi:glycerol-3-phosphate dehydrogenase
MRFVLPYHTALRSRWLLRLGLFIYDHLGGRKILPATTTVDLTQGALGLPLRRRYTTGFEYSDCWVDDARLVVLNAIDAAERGATVLNRTRFVRANRVGGVWSVVLFDVHTQRERTVSTRLIVNAAGPWVSDVMTSVPAPDGETRDYGLRLVQGSHIVVPKIYDHDRCYIFQNGDGRIVFAIPYEGEFTLIGTTDSDYSGRPEDVRITEDETSYLIEAANQYFTKRLSLEDIAWSYSGVRPLFDDGKVSAQTATRDYVLKVEAPAGGAALIHILGGKLTTYRRLAESTLVEIERILGRRGAAWTAGAVLPGGHLGMSREDYGRDFVRRHAWLPDALALRFAYTYGSRASRVIGDASSLSHMGQPFGGGLYQREVDYLVEHEMATSAQDIVARRTKLLLRMTGAEIASVEKYLYARGAQALKFA